MMRNSRLIVAMLAIALTAFTVSCGNPLEGGSSPSGSIIRVVSVEGDDGGVVQPDLFITPCGVDEEGNPTDFEAFTSEFVTVTLLNDSIPNTPQGSSTNSFVTMNRYRVDYSSLDSRIDIPSIDGGGFSVGLPPDSQAGVAIVVMDFTTLDKIRQLAPAASLNNDSFTVRADITIWGEDAFQVRVSVQASITLIITDYNNC